MPRKSERAKIMQQLEKDITSLLELQVQLYIFDIKDKTVDELLELKMI